MFIETKLLFCSHCMKMQTHNGFKTNISSTAATDDENQYGYFFYRCSVCNTQSSYSMYLPRIYNFDLKD